MYSIHNILFVYWLALCSNNAFSAQSDSIYYYDAVNKIEYHLPGAIEDTLKINDAVEGYYGSMGNVSIFDLELPLPLGNDSMFTGHELAENDFDMLSYPIRAVARINAYYDPGGYGCSAVLIDDNFLLTSGHCILREGKRDIWPDSVVIRFAFNDSAVPYSIGEGISKEYFIFQKWAKWGGYDGDFALLKLPYSIGNYIGWLGYGFSEIDTFYYNSVFHRFSYPGTYGFDFIDMYYSYGTFKSYNGILLASGNRKIPGESGSGFFETDNERFTVYGGLTLQDGAPKISRDQFYTIQEIINANPAEPYAEKEIELFVYPNPTSDYLYIRPLFKFNKIISLNIQTVTGQEIYLSEEEKIYGGDKIILNVSGLNAGLYFLKTIIDNNSYLNQVIITN
ncbi:MAG: hypothetical protein COC01_02800 [Bacteroidetes bacterium]|nr:MAG: hypothetical protein COC01_02800 [Bacteroidota bacterium]